MESRKFTSGGWGVGGGGVGGGWGGGVVGGGVGGWGGVVGGWGVGGGGGLVRGWWGWWGISKQITEYGNVMEMLGMPGHCWVVLGADYTGLLIRNFFVNDFAAHLWLICISLCPRTKKWIMYYVHIIKTNDNHSGINLNENPFFFQFRLNTHFQILLRTNGLDFSWLNHCCCQC